MNICAGVFGNAEILKDLGKKTTENDMLIYNHGSSEGVFTYVTPRIQDNSYKIQSLMQILGMIDIPIMIISELTPLVAEQLVALDAYSFQNGIIILDGIDKNQVENLIKNTSLNKYTFTDKSPLSIKEALKKMEPERPQSPVVCPIDTYFDVKSVGTVILGIMKSGKLKKFDKLLIEPLGKEISVKGIQSQDKNFDATDSGMRVGLNLKGVEVEELKRGQVITDAMKKSKDFSLNFKKSPFFKDSLQKGQQIFVSCGLQVSVAIIESVESSLHFKTEHEIAFQSGDKFLLATTTEKLPRIIGGGTIP
ncbi:MAG TPA: EF-Tu/IF-2/RF-3 family GTPase [archaeon]|nr:EF-Tu/IF-2/RF-3 family GTPase [archaeon]